ncbi:hypothetical protein SAMN04515618_102133 [Collimonas sp. OK307]|nr:hypothetical protein SAMN04515618_102133 [Collimonas sp. OK307]
MRSHIGLLPQCLCIVRSRAKVNRLKESYVSRAAQRPPGGEINPLRPPQNGQELPPKLTIQLAMRLRLYLRLRGVNRTFF